MGKYADLDFQYYRPAIVMFNGEYKGMLNIRSRTNEDLIYTTYGGLEDITLVENWGEIKAGSQQDFDDFVDFFSEEGHTFEEYAERMDLEEYANYMLMNLLFDNKDFPGNNLVMWRPREEGGRWRWIAKDTDFGLGIFEDEPEFKTFDWLYTPDYDDHYNWANEPFHTLLFRNLMAIPEFKEMFAERAAIFMGDFLHPDVVADRMNRMFDRIATEYFYHQKTAYYYYSWKPWAPAWLPEIESWMQRRVPFFYEHLAEFYELSAPLPVKILSPENVDVKLNVNGHDLTQGYFDGQYFTGHELKVSGKDSEGSDISRWSYVIIPEEGENIVGHFQGDVNLEIPQGASSIYISPGNSIVQSIDEVEGVNSPFMVYDMSGRFCGRFCNKAEADYHLGSGIYIFRRGSKSFKHLVQ